MDEPLFERMPGDPVELRIRPIPIVPSRDEVALPDAEPDGRGREFPRRYANEQCNSRLAFPLPEGAWRLLWKTELDPDVEPDYLLQAGSRILLRGGDLWELYDDHGDRLAADGIGPGEVVLDPTRERFLLDEPDGFVEGRSLTDGARTFRIFPLFGEGYARTFLSVGARRLLIVSVEVGGAPWEKEPDTSTVEIIDLGAKLRTDENDYLISADNKADLIRDSTTLLAARHRDTLLLATDGAIVATDPNLEATSLLEAEFVPVALSLDEARRIHLMVYRERGYRLWVIAPDGRRQVDVEVPPSVAEAAVPPVVGYDHRIYLIGLDRIIALNPDGTGAWQHAGAGVAGAVVTADGSLLAARESAVVAYDREGEGRTLLSFSGEGVRTQPVLTSDGRLLVATERHLYAFSAD